MTLSALSGSPLGGVALGVAYVFGMVFPLFVMALVWDKARLGEKKFLRAKLVRLRFASRVLVTNTVNIAVAVAFVIMGALVIALANSTDMTGGTAGQAWISRELTGIFGRVQDVLSPVPAPVQGLGILAVGALFVWATLSDRRLPWRRRAAATEDQVPATVSTSNNEKD